MTHTLRYKETGKGPTIILVPGIDGTALMFYRQVPLLSRDFHAITFALPDDPDCTMKSLVQELFRLVERVSGARNHEKVLLCGESFGGALSLSFALAHPECLHGLIIVNSFPVIRKRALLRVTPILLNAIPRGAMLLVRRFTEARVHSAHTRPEDLMEFRQRSKAISRTGYIRRLEILQDYDLRDSLGDIEIPTLFLAGDQDKLVPSVEEARFMAHRMPQATMRVLEGYGHICLINHDLNLEDYITPWLKDVEKGGRLQ